MGALSVDGIAAAFNPALCANTENARGQSYCLDVANLVCSSCRLVQYCNKKCQLSDWPRHKKICKSDLNKRSFIPSWIKENRRPSWASDEIASKFGESQYLWGNMPAVNVLKAFGNENSKVHAQRDIGLLFAASGDLRNVVKSVVEGLSDGYEGQCRLVVNDQNFTIVARNLILIFVALSLEPEEAVPLMLHLWYSALVPRAMIEKLCLVALGDIEGVCEKIKDRSSGSLQAKTFKFGIRSLRIVLTKRQWDELKSFFEIPQGLTSESAQVIRRKVTLAPERIDYLHRALCNQPPPFRFATVTFRTDGILLPHGSSREQFDAPNPTLFHTNCGWPMLDDASPFGGWSYDECAKHRMRATNDLIGSLFFYLRNMLFDFCKRIKDMNIHFQLYNVDVRELSNYLDDKVAFDCIEVSNVCDRGYVGPEKIVSTLSPLLKPKTINPRATLLLLFINAISEVYQNYDLGGKQRFNESFPLMRKFITFTPSTIMSILADGVDSINHPDMIRVSSCYTMFGDFESAFDQFLNDVQMNKVLRTSGMKIRKNNLIVQPWPFRITDKTTKNEFEIRCALMHLGNERYIEVERLRDSTFAI